MAQRMETFESLSGAAFIKMEAQEIAALSRDELVRLALRSRAILTAVATLSAESADRLSVAEVLTMQPQEIAALSASSSSSTSSLLPSEPLPWRPNTRPKLPPGALLDIPDDLLWDIFTIYLPIEAVCRLDSALCQKSRRPEFLALVSTKVLLFNREKVDILTLSNLTSTTHRPLGAAALSWVLKRGIHLASLHLPVDSINKNEQEGIREAVASLALNGHLDKLETVDFFECSYIKDVDFTAILSKCYRSVKSIDIHGCRLTESSAAHVKRCTKLEAFSAKGNELAADMVEIFQSCRKLRLLHLSSFGNRLTDEVVLSVAVHCPLLEHLDLGDCSVVSDTAIRKVAESCPLLQFVSFQNNFTNASVVSLCCHCPFLKQMYLGECRNLTDAAVMAVAESLPALTHFDLCGIAAITSSAVETLAIKCCWLETIGLSDCVNVSDVTLKKIAEHCSTLVDLHVSVCLRVTTTGLASIAMKCSGLKSVYIEYCPQISAEQCSTLKELFPLVTWNN
jgi:hypothetical protein